VTKLRTIWEYTQIIVRVLADWIQPIGMMLAALGAWAAAITYMAPLLHDKFPGLFADIMVFCLAVGPPIWAIRHLHHQFTTHDAEDEDEVTEEATDAPV